MNELNRPQLTVHLDMTADKKLPLLVAHKRLKIKSILLVSAVAIAASGSNKAGLKIQKASAGALVDVAGQPEKGTEAGLAIGASLEVLTSEIILEKGEVLYLSVDITGTLDLEAAVSVDMEVAGS